MAGRVTETVTLSAINTLLYKLLSTSGFSEGYLRGRSFLPKMPSFPPKYIVIITVYKYLTIAEKLSRRDEVSAHEVFPV